MSFPPPSRRAQHGRPARRAPTLLAKELGISRTTLDERLERYGLA